MKTDNTGDNLFLESLLTSAKGYESGYNTNITYLRELAKQRLLMQFMAKEVSLNKWTTEFMESAEYKAIVEQTVSNITLAITTYVLHDCYSIIKEGMEKQ